MPKKGYKHIIEHNKKMAEACKNCPVVYHINGNHFDDRPENRVIVTPKEHAEIHMLQGDIHIFKKGNKFGKGRPRIIK